MSKKFTTGLCRLSYAHIFHPAVDPSGNERYSASLIISKDDQKTLARYKALMDEMAKDPEIIKVLGKGTNYRKPLRDGDEERAEDAAYANSYFLNAKANTEHKPKMVDKDREEIVDESEVYSGCYVQAVLSFYPYNTAGNRGIGCSLSAIRKIKDGKPLTGAVVTDADFDDDLLGSDLSGADDLF